MANQPGSLRIVRLRLAKLNASTNAPSNGASNGYVSTQMMLLRYSHEIEAGEEVTQKTGSGEICISDKADDQVKRVNISLQMCAKDPYVHNFLTGGGMFLSGGVAYGSQNPPTGTALSNKVCLEAWTLAQVGSSQVVTAVTTPNVAYHHWVFPLTKGWVPGDTDLGNGAHVFSYNGQGLDNAAITLNGPFNDWPAYIADEGGVTTTQGDFQDATIPAATTGLVAVPSGS